MTVESLTPDEEVDLFSPSGGYSLFKLLKSCHVTLEAIRSIPTEFLEMTEPELLKTPEDVQRRLKISFWNEFRRAQRLKCEMVLSNVQFGVCSKSYWQKNVVADARFLAWLITPPASEIIVWQELLELGNKKLRRILKLPLVEKRYWKDKTGEVHVEKRTNVSLVKEVRMIVEGLENRLHGSVVQRQELKSLNVNVNTPSQEVSKSATEEMAEIKRLLTRIERAARSVPELPESVILDSEIPEDMPE